MKNNKFIAGILIAATAAVILASFLAKPKAEPEFEGHALSYWILQNVASHPRRNPEAIRALHAMGQPAVQKLAELVETKDSFVREQIARHSDKLGMLDDHLPTRYGDRYLAAHALGAIGTNAASALPALERMSVEPDQTLANVARSAMILVKGESIEELLDTYFDYSNKTNSRAAAAMLRELGAHAESAVPRLLEQLQSTNNRIKVRTLDVLAYVGAESQRSISMMTNLLQDSDSAIRNSAAYALGNSGPLAKDAAPLVARLLDDEDSECRSSALMFFSLVVASNEFAFYQTKVQKMTNDPDESVRLIARELLREKEGAP